MERVPESADDGARDVDISVKDVCTSMGQEQEQEQCVETFAAYQVNQNVMAQANDDALFMHCLPAHRGEEVTAEVLDSRQSVIWQEAENRLHAQKALLELLIKPTI